MVGWILDPPPHRTGQDSLGGRKPGSISPIGGGRTTFASKQSLRGWHITAGLRGALLAAAITAVPPLIALISVLSEGQELATASAVAWLDLHFLIVAAGAALCAHWHTTRDETVGWTVAALVGSAMSATPFAMVDMTAMGAQSGATGDVTGVVLYVPLFVLLACASTRVPIPRGLPPVVIGAVWGSFVLVFRVAYPWIVDHPVSLPEPWGAVVGATASTGFLAGCLWLRRGQGGLPMPAYTWVSLALLTSMLLGPVGTSGATLQSWPTVVALVVISAGLAQTATLSLVRSLADGSRPAATPVLRSLPVHGRLQEDELFHELRSTVADISTASQLLSLSHDRLTESHRRRLSSGLAAEAARLARLVSPPPSVDSSSVPLDDVLAPLVECQRANGHDIRWEPSGHVAHGCADDVTEIVHILLHNALRHAPGTPVELSVHRLGDDVEIKVSDAGPGIPPAIRRSLFERGVHGADSPGSGLGLFLARRLANEHGGQLQLRHQARRGASFVLTLPHPEGETA